MKNLLLLTCIFCFFACQEVDIKDDAVVVQPTTPSFDFDVPTDFDWSVHKVLDVEVIIADQYNGDYNYIVEIYNEEFNVEDTLLFLDKGITSGTKIYKSKVAVLKDSKTVSVVQVDPNGNRALVTVPIVGSSVHFDFNSLAGNTTSKSISTKSILTRTDPNKEPVVPEGALSIPENGILLEGKTYVFNTGDPLITLANNVKLYVKGGLNFKGGTPETLDGSNANHLAIENLSTDVQLYILKDASLIKEKGHITFGDGVDLYNYGIISLGGGGNLTFVSNNRVDNYNKFSVGGRLNIKSNAIVNNYDEIDTHYGVSMSSGAQFTNYSFVKTHGNPVFDVNGKSELINYGYLDISGDLDIKDATVIVRAGAMIRCYAVNLLQQSAKLVMDDNSKFVANECHINGAGKVLSNTDRSSSVIIAGAHSWAFPMYGKPEYVGKICLDNINKGGVAGNGLIKKDWGPNAVIGNPGAKVIVIPATKFNDGGYNTNNDGDIVSPEPSDNLEYFEPIYKVAFEDNFPETDDFDMNDLVLTWQIGTQKNAGGKIVKVGVRISVIAVGASKQIAAAMKIVGINNISTAKLTKDHNFSKYFEVQNGLEVGNNDVVVPLFEDAHVLFNKTTSQFVNVGKKATMASYDFDVELDLSDPIESISIENFDFFIVIEGDMNSRTEIHTFGCSTTSKASNITDFGVNNTSIYGINTSSNFKHSMESVSIIDSYTEFKGWATSGGVSNPRWFNNPESTIVEPYTK